MSSPTNRVMTMTVHTTASAFDLPLLAAAIDGGDAAMTSAIVLADPRSQGLQRATIDKLYRIAIGSHAPTRHDKKVVSAIGQIFLIKGGLA